MPKTSPLGNHWQKGKTHCPYGHPYSPENTYVTSLGHRQCRTCNKARSQVRVHTGAFAAGWRDQECPICGAKWFVDASLHVRHKHGKTLRGLVSESRRWASAAHLSELNQFDCDPALVKARRKRWAKAIAEERTKGGSYLVRLAKRWRISRSGVNARIRRLHALGLISDAPGMTTLYKDRNTHCGRGHPLDEANTYWAQGRRFCRECGRERSRRYMARKYVPRR